MGVSRMLTHQDAGLMTYAFRLSQTSHSNASYRALPSGHAAAQGMRDGTSCPQLYEVIMRATMRPSRHDCKRTYIYSPSTSSFCQRLSIADNTTWSMCTLRQRAGAAPVPLSVSPLAGPLDRLLGVS